MFSTLALGTGAAFLCLAKQLADYMVKQIRPTPHIQSVMKHQNARSMEQFKELGIGGGANKS
eukprot:scaffold7997_cov19-Tisochrysis_lutea.AAC.1